MATPITNYVTANPASRTFSWTGIFGGAFLFLAIEITFGVLGLAVFASESNPASSTPVGSGIHWGMGIWMVALTVIALFFAGKASSRLSAAPNRTSGLYAGLVTFGMCVFATLGIGALALASTEWGHLGIPSMDLTRLAEVLSVGGFWIFVALVLGMISAAAGGMQGAMGGALRIGRSHTHAEEQHAA